MRAVFNTFRIRALLAVAWVLIVGGLWWGYRGLARSYDLTPQLEQVDKAAAAGDWHGVEEATRRLEERWQKARPVVELNHGGMLLEDFELVMGRITGAVAARDAGLVRTELSGLRIQWQGLMSPFPDGR